MPRVRRERAGDNLQTVPMAVDGPMVAKAATAAKAVSAQPPNDTCHAILAAARKVFAEHGYHLASMAEIARGAGVVRATVYNHFPKKVDVLRAIVNEYLNGYVLIGNRLRAAAEDAPSLFSLLEQMVREAIDWRISNADLRPTFDLAKHLDDSGWAESNAAADQALISWIASIHQANSKVGITRPGLDIQFATLAVYSMIETALSSFDVTSPASQVDHVAHQLTLLHWYAIYDIDPDQAPEVRKTKDL
jgi:AcrR family transcriptional regulator